MDAHCQEGLNGANLRYVATFFSHFDAVRFRRLCRERTLACELAPVPRSLSSSCGTCAYFDEIPLSTGEEWDEGIEAVVLSVNGDGQAPYESVYQVQ